MFKIRPLVDHLNAVFPEYYKPSRHLSIDEMMIGTRCRVAFLQYIPKKPTRFRIKVWVNSEAKTGYYFVFKYTLVPLEYTLVPLDPKMARQRQRDLDTEL